jgi:predicted phosphodiesterase
MRYAFISDIHANIEALSPVLAAIDALGVDAIYCMGDIVGRNANPNEVIDALRARNVRGVAGNHERATVGAADMTYFSAPARRAVLFTRDRLTPENRRYLEDLPPLRTVDDHLLLVHAALHPEPNDQIYLNSPEQLSESLNALRAREGGPRVALFGHTHRAGVFRLRVRGVLEGQVEASTEEKQRLYPDSVYLMNPGSVGQSRDGDWRASFMIYDRESSQVEIHRVPFDRVSALMRSRELSRYEPGAPAT